MKIKISRDYLLAEIKLYNSSKDNFGRISKDQPSVKILENYLFAISPEKNDILLTDAQLFNLLGILVANPSTIAERIGVNYGALFSCYKQLHQLNLLHYDVFMMLSNSLSNDGANLSPSRLSEILHSIDMQHIFRLLHDAKLLSLKTLNFIAKQNESHAIHLFNMLTKLKKNGYLNIVWLSMNDLTDLSSEKVIEEFQSILMNDENTKLGSMKIKFDKLIAEYPKDKDWVSGDYTRNIIRRMFENLLDKNAISERSLDAILSSSSVKKIIFIDNFFNTDRNYTKRRRPRLELTEMRVSLLAMSDICNIKYIRSGDDEEIYNNVKWLCENTSYKSYLDRMYFSNNTIKPVFAITYLMQKDMLTEETFNLVQRDPEIALKILIYLNSLNIDYDPVIDIENLKIFWELITKEYIDEFINMSGINFKPRTVEGFKKYELYDASLMRRDGAIKSKVRQIIEKAKDREEIVEKSRMLMQLKRQGHPLFNLPNELLVNIAAHVSTDHRISEAEVISRNNLNARSSNLKENHEIKKIAKNKYSEKQYNDQINYLKKQLKYTLISAILVLPLIVTIPRLIYLYIKRPLIKLETTDCELDITRSIRRTWKKMNGIKIKGKDIHNTTPDISNKKVLFVDNGKYHRHQLFSNGDVSKITKVKYNKLKNESAEAAKKILSMRG